MVLARKDFHGLKSLPFIWLLALTMLMGGCFLGPQFLKGNHGSLVGSCQPLLGSIKAKHWRHLL